MRSPQSRILLPAFLILFCAPLGAQKIDIPDIPGYKTLQCDFHMHTVFSDGVVWPAVRVDEAAREGLAAISITDHLENRRKDVTSSRNRTHDTAKQSAKDKRVILIRGGEITRAMPPGHLNAIFSKDNDALYKEDWRESLAEAKKQGAFITWNHPGWDRQQPHTTRWLPEHEEIYKNGWMHGIEIANGGDYFPEAFQWALDKKLTIIGASDAHQPIQAYADFAKGEHRTMTLVFAKARTEEAIREALDNRRTAVFFKDFIHGEEQWLRPLLEKSLVVQKITHKPAATSGASTSARTEKYEIVFKNNSGLLFCLKKIVPGAPSHYFREYIIKPQGQLTLSVGTPAETGSDEISFEVSNFLTTPKTPLIHTIKLLPTPAAKTTK